MKDDDENQNTEIDFKFVMITTKNRIRKKINERKKF